MTRKDYVLIANAIKGARHATPANAEPNAEATLDRVVQHMADALTTTNHLFDRARFVAACR